jgi:hypothetical protein
VSDDWKPGDLALCVALEDGGDLLVTPAEPGQVFTVAYARDVTGLRHPVLGPVFGLYLAFDERQPERWGYKASHFRKIKPLTDEEREQFFADLNERVPT